jgi:hypothetical protein
VKRFKNSAKKLLIFYTCERSKNKLQKTFGPSPWPIGLGMEVSNLEMFILDPLWEEMESNEDLL